MENPPPGIRIRGSARTSTGQVRENNEDNVRLWVQDSLVLAIVADGMGGAVAGEEASRIAVESVQQDIPIRESRPDVQFQRMGEDIITQKLRDAIRSANLMIIERAESHPELRGMGTTATLAFVRGNTVIVAHVGDSRAYLVSGREHSIKQITADHSFVEALLTAGHITPEQAEEHPMRNVLYRALGQAEDLDVDVYSSDLRAGDKLVLCSDGLTRHVKPHEIAELALSDENPDVASQKMIDLANMRGGEDNVSVIVIAVEREMPLMSAGEPLPITDEEDTLVLSDRKALPHPPETPLIDINHPLVSISTPRSGLVIEHKMAAERASDEDKGTDTPTEHDPLDNAIASRRTFEILTSPPEPSSPNPPHPRETDPDGKDNNLPPKL